MMHLQVEADIRNGLALMKYAVNHPFMFSAQVYNNPDENQDAIDHHHNHG